MRVKAIQRMYYGKQMREPGDVYEMDDRESNEAMILSTLGKIEIVKDETATPKYRTAALKAEEPTEEPKRPAQPMTTEDNPLVGGQRRFYRRRDMKAEGT